MQANPTTNNAPVKSRGLKEQLQAVTTKDELQALANRAHNSADYKYASAKTKRRWAKIIQAKLKELDK